LTDGFVIKNNIKQIGVANILEDGEDITIVGTSNQALKALQAAVELAKEGISAEVIDPIGF